MSLAVVLWGSAYGSPVSPGPTLATWAEHFSIPGPSLMFTVDAGGNGHDTYAIEVRRSGIVTVTGTVLPSIVTIVLQYDDGVVQTFVGTGTDARHLVGGFGGESGAVTFTRRETYRPSKL